MFLGEAVALGLATIMCRRLGPDRPTFIRDEPAGALDAEKEVAYVAMIRRAAGIIGARTVLLVSHSEQVKALCDARIEVYAARSPQQLDRDIGDRGNSDGERDRKRNPGCDAL